MIDKGKIQIVTEIGSFGSLNIEDPTITDVNVEDEDLEKIVKEALEEED